MKECKVCLIEHDEEIHAATLRVKEWFREFVLLGQQVNKDPVIRQEPPLNHPDTRQALFF